MTHVKGFSRRSSTIVEVEGLAVLMSVQDLLEVTLAEEDATASEEI